MIPTSTRFSSFSSLHILFSSQIDILATQTPLSNVRAVSCDRAIILPCHSSTSRLSVRLLHDDLGAQLQRKRRRRNSPKVPRKGRSKHLMTREPKENTFPDSKESWSGKHPSAICSARFTDASHRNWSDGYFILKIAADRRSRKLIAEAEAAVGECDWKAAFDKCKAKEQILKRMQLESDRLELEYAAWEDQMEGEPFRPRVVAGGIPKENKPG